MDPSIGERLRSQRLKKNLSLQQVADSTHIRLQFLQALENDHFSDLPSRIQARGFIRLYASEVGLDPALLLKMLDDQMAAPEEPALAASQVPEKKTQKIILTKKKVKTESAPPIPQDSEEIEPRADYGSIGRTLVERRESLGLTLTDIEDHTHIKKTYLEMLEKGRMGDLSSPIQARGLLSNYAEFLNLDADAILDQFAVALQAQYHEKHAPEKKEVRREPIKKSRFSTLRQFLSTDLIIGVVLIAAVFVFVIWGASQILTTRVKEASTTLPAVPNLLLATASSTIQGSTTAQVTGTQVTAQGTSQTDQGTLSPTMQSTPTIFISNAALQLNITANQRTFLRVIADGKQVYNDRVYPGNAYQFTATNRLELIAGSATALNVVFNQTDMGSLGSMGQEVWLVFTRGGVQTPTSQFTQTPTNTLPPTLTPNLPTETPTPTVTLFIPNP
jgi:cytoskeleton protein RodZ